MTAPRSYSTVEVSRRLGVSIQTVQRWVDSGHLKAWKTLGGHRRISAESAEALLADAGVAVERPAAPAPRQRTVVDLVAENAELLAALQELSAMHAHTWDTTDGGLSMFSSSVQRFEAAHEKAQAAIKKAGGTP